MAGGSKVDTVYLATLVGAERAGRLLAHAGLVPAGAAQGCWPARIDMVDFWRCCAQNILLTNDESHGVAAEPVPRGSLSVLITAAKEADTLAGALRRFVEAARLVRKECRLSLSRGRGVLRLTVAPARTGSLRAEIYVECFAIVAHCALRWMTGRRLQPVRVRGAALLRDMGGELLDALHAPVARRGEGVSIDYALADLTAPVLPQKYSAWGEAEFANFVAMLGQEEAPLLPRDHAQVLALLERGLSSQEDVAAALRISVPTLRRRLAASNLSFREISADYRTRRLKDLLATNLPLADIAEQLGLSDERSLRRFARDHLGTAPAHYREAVA
ncbi:MAG TPA: helix-turn-helix domain-containing protein [Novosphingobium sp.]|nr:helix-turn-helix domain-containing protein [Novosphingobium sp.]